MQRRRRARLHEEGLELHEEGLRLHEEGLGLHENGEQTVDAAPGKTPEQTAIDAATLVKGSGATVFAWGFGKASLPTLKQIATDPSKALLVQGMDELVDHIAGLQATVCIESPSPPPPSPSPPPPSPSPPPPSPSPPPPSPSPPPPSPSPPPPSPSPPQPSPSPPPPSPPPPLPSIQPLPPQPSQPPLFKADSADLQSSFLSEDLTLALILLPAGGGAAAIACGYCMWRRRSRRRKQNTRNRDGNGDVGATASPQDVAEDVSADAEPSTELVTDGQLVSTVSSVLCRPMICFGRRTRQL